MIKKKSLCANNKKVCKKEIDGAYKVTTVECYVHESSSIAYEIGRVEVLELDKKIIRNIGLILP